MKKSNLWSIVKDEGEMIIGKIVSGECKCKEEYRTYCDSVYSWTIASKINDYVLMYLTLNEIELPWCESEIEQ